MPSGGGAAGGGGGGGGGGFGGGGYHSSGSGGGGGGGCVTLVALAVTIAIVLVIVLPITLTRNSSRDTDVATDLYSPGDSRLMSFSSFFCDGVNLNVESTDTVAVLELVSSTPSLTDTNLVNISDSRVLMPGFFWFWQYHLYPNSNVSIDICIDLTGIDVYIVKGNSNANDWASSPSSDHAEVTRSIGSRCPEELETITYTVTEEDEYYVFLYNSLSETEGSYSANLQFERFEYALPSESNTSDPLASCSAPSGGECGVSIPYGTGSQQVLVVTTIPENVDWGENVDINISCNRRDWAYALVVLIPLLAFIAIIVGLVLLCIYWKKLKNSYTLIKRKCTLVC